MQTQATLHGLVVDWDGYRGIARPSKCKNIIKILS